MLQQVTQPPAGCCLGGGCKQHRSISYISFCATLPQHLHQDFMSYSYYKNCKAQTLHMLLFFKSLLWSTSFISLESFSFQSIFSHIFKQWELYRNMLKNCAEIFHSILFWLLQSGSWKISTCFMIIDIILWKHWSGIIRVSNVCLAL